MILSFGSNDFVFPPPDFSHKMTVQNGNFCGNQFSVYFFFVNFLFFFDSFALPTNFLNAPESFIFFVQEFRSSVLCFCFCFLSLLRSMPPG